MNTKVTTPFRFRNIGSKTLLTNEVGDFGMFKEGIVERMLNSTLTEEEETRLGDLLIHFDENQDWKLLTLARRIRGKSKVVSPRLSYIILIPTLRCDLSCSYCQVSRAPLHEKGFDWDAGKLAAFEDFLVGRQVEEVKIEFQGGEPTLRPDLIREVIKITEKRCSKSEFVICTNLQSISKATEDIYEKPNVSISTSIDGPEEVMDFNRTKNRDLTNQFFRNFYSVLNKYGPNKIAALPTVSANMLEDPERLVDFYISLGFDTIFLRPVNYMGFARKTYRELANDIERWIVFYRRAIEYIAKINENTFFEEFYFSLLLKRIFHPIENGFVDFRSPNFFMNDYCVIDFDGKIYPSDEARMLSRTRHIDLSLGELGSSIDTEKVGNLNWHSMNQVEPDCVHCAYMPYCGIDIIDDLSRYNRIDSPKFDTWFCRRHMMLFDFIFDKIASHDIGWLNIFLKWIYRKADPPHSYEIFYDKAEI